MRELIVIRDKNGRLKEYVQKIEFDPQFFKKKRITNQPLLSPDSKDFTGTVKLYNTSNFFIRGSIFKDGKLVGRILPKGGFNAGLTSSLGLGTKLLRTYGEIGTEENPTEEEEVIIEVPIKDPEWPEIPPPGDPFPDPIDPPDFDPPYPGGGWGTGDGTTYVPPTQPPSAYDCNCNCSEAESEMTSAESKFEPKWGQLGNKDDISREMDKARARLENFNSQNFSDRLDALADHFHANRTYVRENGVLKEAEGSVAVDRYIYTENMGWIDMHHFFYAAGLADTWGKNEAINMTTAAEVTQFLTDKSSAFSYEDMPSNIAGILFYAKYGAAMKDADWPMSIAEAAVAFLTNVAKAKNPEEAPNFEYIPHILDGNVPKNYGAKGLTGEQLRQKAREEFCKKSDQTQNNIKEAHQKLPHSSK